MKCTNTTEAEVPAEAIYADQEVEVNARQCNDVDGGHIFYTESIWTFSLRTHFRLQPLGTPWSISLVEEGSA